MTNPRPVPGRVPLLGHTVPLLRDPLKFFTSLSSHGEVVKIRLGPLPVHVVTTPELAWQVLATDADKFDKGLVFDKMRPLFGDGLATSNGELNRRQRRLVMPAFGRTRIAGYAEHTMTTLADDLASSWRPGEVVEFDKRMQDLVLTIAGQTLFSTALGEEALAEIRHSIPVMLKYVLIRAFSPKFVEKLPIPANRRFDTAAARLREVIGETVVAAREDGADHGDLLSMLLLARDEDTGEGMSDRQVHDEVITILTTGAETTAVALAWFFHELGQHPEVERRFHAEVDEVLGGRAARFEDLPDLVYTHQIVNEIVRRTPPLILMRRAREDVELGGVPIPAGSEVAVSQHTLHRDPRWFPEPDRFDPDRWAPGRTADLPKGAYIPFGAGARLCPGHVFAPTEIGIVAATIGARWRLVPVPGKKVYAQIKVTMQPNRLPMTVVPRKT
ncbi:MULTISPECIES: cytochrome P450 [unclassified Amycolatopsis]|uniref:cytochrome P450 n=1 Tax=unclassified Amycolatopsis TaxID=2618356 RepID=UPI0028768145|nr:MULTISPECIES: cytochrome P450 [unclassified Amycolatopsis]MDS0139599.1 cytochrome P450 [Amycolatopsis sp. 505]MDS0147178.1 cytochrome P450 [Amycolatopsis sp. CM201R]